MSDCIVNGFFKKHYPSDLKPEDFEFTPMLGGMRKISLARRKQGVETIFPPMECADGFTISVQGHAGSYSRPRDDFADHYTAVEAGYPSAREELLLPFAEDADNPTETVYGYVPVSVIAEIITKHGGLRT